MGHLKMALLCSLQAMVPDVLTVWDFCQQHRALLRLPPIPLARLEAVFLDDAHAHAAETAAVRHSATQLVAVLLQASTSL